MDSLKMFSLAAMVAMSLMALVGAGAASATELYKNTSPSPNDTLGIGTEIEMSLSPATSFTWTHTVENKSIGSFETCTNGSTKLKIEKSGGEGVHPSGKITSLSFLPCTHTMHVIKAGEQEIQHIAGTTNGSVISKEAETTIFSTIFGFSCIIKTGAGTKTGTLTGATSSTGYATFDVEGNVLMGICGTGYLSGSFRVTNPTGLVVEAK